MSNDSVIAQLLLALLQAQGFEVRPEETGVQAAQRALEWSASLLAASGGPRRIVDDPGKLTLSIHHEPSPSAVVGRAGADIKRGQS